MAGDTNETLFSEDEYLKFPEPTRKKLARFLSDGQFHADVSFEEVELLRLAAGKLRHESLDSACTELEQQFDTESQEAFMPVVSSACSNDQNPSGINDQSSYLAMPQEHYTQAYHVSFIKDRRNKPFAIVYDVMKRNLYVANITKGSAKFCTSSCVYVEDEAPYFLLRSGREKRERILSYDVILNKWEKLPKPKRISIQSNLVEINKRAYMFGGASLAIHKLSHSKWRSCATLIQQVFNPVHVVVGTKLTIFDDKTVQVFDASTNIVNKFHTFTIPQGVAVNIDNYACVLTNSTIVRFDESSGTCNLQRLNSNFLTGDVLTGAITHKRQVHIITQKNGLHVYSLSLEDFSITNICSTERQTCPQNFSILSSCVLQSSQEYIISPFLSYEEERRRKILR